MSAEFNNTKSFTTEIAGLTLQVKTTHDEETIKKLSKLVNEKVSEVMGSHSDLSFQNALILSALNLAEDYMFLKEKAFNDIESIEEKAKALFSIGEGLSAEA